MITTQTIPIDGALPHNHCPHCDAEVLVYRDLDDHGDFSFHCLDCHALLQRPHEPSWSPEQVIDAGYPMEGILASAPPRTGGCQNGGCSGGSCSTHD